MYTFDCLKKFHANNASSSTELEYHTYPSWTTVAVHVLFEFHDTFVEVVVVVRAHVDEDAVTEDIAQILLALPVVCDVAGQIERLPVLDGLMVDLSGDLVPGLRHPSVN
jgi:hypothetical protein